MCILLLSVLINDVQSRRGRARGRTKSRVSEVTDDNKLLFRLQISTVIRSLETR